MAILTKLHQKYGNNAWDIDNICRLGESCSNTKLMLAYKNIEHAQSWSKTVIYSGNLCCH